MQKSREKNQLVDTYFLFMYLSCLITKLNATTRLHKVIIKLEYFD